MMPRESNRIRHKVHGRVAEYTTHITGHLWWKKRLPAIVVEILESERVRVNAQIHRSASLQYDPPPDVRGKVEIGFLTAEDRNLYQIGETVELKFSIALGSDVFFLGADPFRWDGIQKIDVPSEVPISVTG